MRAERGDRRSNDVQLRGQLDASAPEFRQLIPGWDRPRGCRAFRCKRVDSLIRELPFRFKSQPIHVQIRQRVMGSLVDSKHGSNAAAGFAVAIDLK